jgi:hypothetical protein
VAVSDHELWACALQVLTSKGDGADAFVAGRVETLARADDLEGVRTWRAIADRIDRLRDVEAPAALH